MQCSSKNPSVLWRKGEENPTDFFTGVPFWTPACIYMHMTIRSFDGDIQLKVTEWPTKGSWRTQVKVSPWMSLVCWQPIADDASMHQFSQSCLVSCVWPVFWAETTIMVSTYFYIVYLEIEIPQYCLVVSMVYHPQRPHLCKATGKAPRHGKWEWDHPQKEVHFGKCLGAYLISLPILLWNGYWKLQVWGGFLYH